MCVATANAVWSYCRRSEAISDDGESTTRTEKGIIVPANYEYMINIAHNVPGHPGNTTISQEKFPLYDEDLRKTGNVSVLLDPMLIFMHALPYVGQPRAGHVLHQPVFLS